LALKKKNASTDSLRVSLRKPKKPRPGRPCHLCNHPELRQATADLAAGMSTREIGKRYGCSAMAVSKHVRRHMHEALRQLDLTQNVVDQLRRLSRRIDVLLTKAEWADDLRTAVAAAREARESLMAIARLTGEDKSIRSEPVKVEIVYRDVPLPAPLPDKVIEASAERLDLIEPLASDPLR
jgi:hypothetical protein